MVTKGNPGWRGALGVLVAVMRLFPVITIALYGIDQMDEENRKTLLPALNKLLRNCQYPAKRMQLSRLNI